ncbi:MAG: type VI secretion system baseplate subunit TssE [Desulfuromonas sp.]
MTYALFDILLGRYQNGQPIGGYLSAGELQLSIRDHLQRLLNGRRGVLPHLPTYGMPDVAGLFEALPYSLDDMTAAVCQAIEQFEHRILQLQVRARPATPGEKRVCFDIFGRSHCGQTLKYIVSLYSSGSAQVDLQAEGTWHE